MDGGAHRAAFLALVRMDLRQDYRVWTKKNLTVTSLGKNVFEFSPLESFGPGLSASRVGIRLAPTLEANMPALDSLLQTKSDP